MKDEVFQTMKKIADERVLYYKSDFTEHDTRSYDQMDSGTHFIWSVRPTGTYILGIPSRLKYKEADHERYKEVIHQKKQEFEEYIKRTREFSEAVLKTFTGDDVKWFLVIKGQKINEITYDEATKIIKRK